MDQRDASYKGDAPLGGEVIKRFDLLATTEEKSKYSYGKSIAEYIVTTLNGTNTYFWTRNNRFRINRDLANNRVDASRYQDRMEMNGKLNYLNIPWKCLSICNTIISKIVGRWMSRNEKIVCTAIDSLSVKDKDENYKEALFVMETREHLEELQNRSGVPMIPQDQFVAEDKEELELWRNDLQRLPEEILFEEGVNDVLQANGFFDVLKEKLLHDSAEVGLLGTYVWMDEDGVIHVEWSKPENSLYSYTEFPDMRDTAWRGRVRSLKISEFRAKYGVQFGGTWTEEQIFTKIVPNCTEYQLYDKIKWLNEWNMTMLRPYDEWNMDIVEFEIKTLDVEPYTVITTNQGMGKKVNGTLVKRGIPTKKIPTEEYVANKHWQIYRGVYARGSKQLLEWGRKTNMIMPQDPKKLGDVDFSYTFYMYQNNDMRNIAIPDKIEEVVDNMIVILKKMEQLIAKMRPVGAAVNMDALQELDYGLGDANKTIDWQKLYDQTGMLYFRGRDGEGNPLPVPITELQNSGFLPQMQALIAQYEFQHRVLQDQLGEDPNLMSAAIKPRVAEGNVQAATAASNNSTEHMYDAYCYVLEETARKVACLMKQSVLYGADVYRQIMGEEVVKGRVYDIKTQMLPTDMEIQRLDMQLQQAIQSNPDLVMYLDSAKVLRIAKEDVKLAELFFRQSMKKMIKDKQQQAAQNSQLNARQQQMGAQAKAQGDQQTEQLKGELTLKNTALAGLLALAAKGPLPPEWQTLTQALITNILDPTLLENMQQQQALMASQQQGQQPQQTDQQQAGQPDQSQPQMQPQNQIQAA